MSEAEEINKIIEDVSPHYAQKGQAGEEHQLTYDSSSETLEPVYFWILDMMNGLFKGEVEKLVDNFSSTPGSGHFAELGARATRMQEEAMKIFGTVNTVIKSIINIIYDLKEFQIVLKQYEDAKSEDKNMAEAALLGLKQRWMDNVDMKRGRGSINMLAQDLNFVTLRDAFMIVKSVKDVKKLDLNDRVKRILEPRVQEFFEWKDRSEVEMKKRYEIERTYLKSQVASLKLYSRWARPYLKAAAELEMKEFGREPALVKAFNTILLELTLIGKKELDVRSGAIEEKALPREFEKIKLKRKYYSCVIVDFRFRGIPQRVSQQAHYAFGGRAEVVFRAYALNEDELFLLEKELDESDFKGALGLVEEATTASIDELTEDIESFLKEEKQEEKKSKAGVNPFLALVGHYEKREQAPEKREKEILKVKKDSYEESVIRKYTEQIARKMCFDIFDIYKKAHGMPSHPSPFGGE